MTHITNRCLPLSRRAPLLLPKWIAIWRSRRALARLEPHMLRDIGVSRAEAHAEATRPVWDAPAAWRGVA